MSLSESDSTLNTQALELECIEDYFKPLVGDEESTNGFRAILGALVSEVSIDVIRRSATIA